MFITLRIRDEYEHVSEIRLRVHSSTQAARKRDRLKPEIHRWVDVVNSAEHHEIAQSVDKWRP